MANKPIIPFNPNGPVLSASNDTGDTKPYVGKPKPMPPTTRQPGMGYSPGGGSFDASALRRAPRPTMILPGQGQGPMPVGTKPLPSPVVKDARGGGGIDFEKLNDPFYRGFRAPSPEEIAQHEADRAAGRLGGGMTRGGDIGFGEDPNKRYGGGGQIGFNNDPRYGGGGYGYAMGALSPDGKGGYLTPDGRTVQIPNYGGQMGDSGFGQDPNKSYPMPFDRESAMRELGGRGLINDPRYGGGQLPTVQWIWEDHNYDRAGGLGMIRDHGMGLGPRNPEGYGWSIGATIGAKPHWNGPPGTEPSGNWGPGRPLPPGWDGGMKPGGMGQGGEQVQPGMGMPTQYGGGPSGRGGVEVPYDGMNGAVQRGPGAPGMPSGGKPPQGPQPGMPGQGGGRQPLRPGMEYRPGGGQRPQRPQQGGGANPQAMQQGAQALYSDNTIPHEFKGQLLQAAQSGNAQAFNEMLFNSGIPHETKLRLQQLFGYGSGAGAAPQAATPDQGQNQVQQSYNGGKGSPYYGAF